MPESTGRCIYCLKHILNNERFGGLWALKVFIWEFPKIGDPNIVP